MRYIISLSEASGYEVVGFL